MRYLIPFIILTLFMAPLSRAQDIPQNDKPFGLWLEEFKKEALKKGISQDTLDDAFADAQPIDRVIELDHKQPESVLTPEQYLANIVTEKRIAKGRAMLKENRRLLREVSQEYGVQPQFIVALWGIETLYGANSGGFRTVDALMTLAYDGRRSDFFRSELLDALRILQEEHMPSADMKGSWAGAMGQCQFMPDSYLKYAVDYEGDGKRDIWNSKGDIFASIANYLESSGWKSSEGWGRRVKLPDDFDESLADIEKPRTLLQWRRLGVRKANGQPLPAKKTKASLIMVGEGDDAMPLMVYGNYKVLLKWNRSRYFATAVGMLADQIGK